MKSAEHRIPTRRNARARLRFLGNEAAGALGDLGTFVPLVAAMTQVVGLDAGSILLFAGLANIVSGLVFQIPIAVQPMKAIAALAIAGALSRSQVPVAGLTVAIAVLAMCGLGVMRRLTDLVPRPLVGAVQMAVAVKLAIAGLQMSLYLPGAQDMRPLWGAGGLLVAAGALLLAFVLRHQREWLAVSLTVMGLIGAAALKPSLLSGLSVHLWRPEFASFDEAALAGLWLGGLPQLPLTLLNSVLAVSVLASDLFPRRAEGVEPSRIALSVAAMNLVSCPLGGMPMCHGSGGLAGQYHFGARTGLSMVMLGTVKMLFGLLLGATAAAWMLAFPGSVLGIFLLLAGAQLARASRCWTGIGELVTAVGAIVVHQASGNLALGFAAGWAIYAALNSGIANLVPSRRLTSSTRQQHEHGNQH